jgi:hypothetical protein
MTLTEGSTVTKLVVDPTSYGKVDITDFAPRAVSGTPTFSTLGLYLDVAQEGFGHGFGRHNFGEPQSYAYSGQLIDTRHGFIQHYTNYSTAQAAAAGWYVNDMAFVTVNDNSIPVMAGPSGVEVLKPSDNTRASMDTFSLDYVRVLNAGKYQFLSSAGRLKVIYIEQPDVVTSTRLTFNNAAFEDTNQWLNGYVWIFDGTGADTKVAITASAATTVDVGGWGGNQPDTDSYIMLIVDTGADGNPPNDFESMCLFGGSAWAVERDTHYLHFWAATNGSDAEGDGTTDAGVITVGPPGGKIVNVQPYKNQLYVFRTDGIWTINEQDTDALAYHTLDFGGEKHDTNFQTVLVWQGFLLYTVRNKLYKYRSGQQDMTPPVWDEYPPYKQFGNFRGLLARGKFLYVLGQSNVANATEESATEGYAGFVSLMATDGVGWHKMLDLPGTAIPTKFDVWLDPTDDLLYLMTYDDTNGTLYTVQLQTYSDLPNPTYPTSGTQNWYSSYHDYGMKRIPKSFGSVTLHGDFPSNTSVAASYRIDDTQAWTAMSTSFTSDMQEVDFAVGTTGKRIQLKLTLDTTTAAATPIVKSVIIKVMLRPEVLYGITCDIIISDNISDQKRMMLGHTAEEIRTNLLSARNSVSPVTLVDLGGDSNSVYLASMRFGVIGYEDSNAIQEIAHCTFVFV